MFSLKQSRGGIVRKALLAYYHSKVVHHTANKEGEKADKYVKRLEHAGPLSLYHIAFGVRAAILSANKARAEELLDLPKDIYRISVDDQSYLNLSLRQAESVLLGTDWSPAGSDREIMSNPYVRKELKKFLPMLTMP